MDDPDGKPELHTLLYTTAEAAKMLKTNIKVIRRAISDGKLRYIQIGKSRRFTIQDLETFIERQRAPELPSPRHRSGRQPRQDGLEALLRRPKRP